MKMLSRNFSSALDKVLMMPLAYNPLPIRSSPCSDKISGTDDQADPKAGEMTQNEAWTIFNSYIFLIAGRCADHHLQSLGREMGRLVPEDHHGSATAQEATASTESP